MSPSAVTPPRRLSSSPSAYRLPIGRRRLSPELHDAANPIDKPDAPLAQRRRQIAEIEMHVGVDQPGQNGHVAQGRGLLVVQASRLHIAVQAGRLHHNATIRSAFDAHERRRESDRR